MFHHHALSLTETLSDTAVNIQISKIEAELFISRCAIYVFTTPVCKTARNLFVFMQLLLCETRIVTNT